MCCIFTNKKYLLTFLLIVTVLFSVKAQNSSKGIYIVNVNSKVPLQDVSVQSVDVNFNTITDYNGFVDLTKMPLSAKKSRKTVG